MSVSLAGALEMITEGFFWNTYQLLSLIDVEKFLFKM